MSLHEELRWDDNTEKAGSDLVYSFYDALYAWVSVLHSLTVTYPNIEFIYANTSLVEMITEQYFKLTFEGITGQINFNSSTGFVNHQVNLYQISSGLEVKVGSLNLTAINIIMHPSFSHISDQIHEVVQPHGGVVAFFMAAQLVELL